MNRVIGSILLMLVLAVMFVNFSEVETDETDGTRATRTVQPLSADEYVDPALLDIEVAPCRESQKNTVYLHLADAQLDERITGRITDSETGVSVEIDLVLGRDFAIGSCADRSVSEAAGEGRIKICFPRAVGSYFRVSLEGETWGLEREIYGQALCEDSQWASIMFTKEQ